SMTTSSTSQLTIHFFYFHGLPHDLPSFPTRRSSDLIPETVESLRGQPLSQAQVELGHMLFFDPRLSRSHLITCNTCHSLGTGGRSEEHTSELQSRENIVCRLLLEKTNKDNI